MYHSLAYFPETGRVHTLAEDELEYSAADLRDLLHNQPINGLEVLGPGRVAAIPNRNDLVLRWNFQTISPRLDEATDQAKRLSHGLVALRKAGLPVIEHTLFVTEQPLHTNARGAQLYIAAERVAHCDSLAESMSAGVQDRSRLANIGQALVKYYGWRRNGPHLSDLTTADQYTADGRLMDLDPKFVTSDTERQREKAFAKGWAQMRVH